MMIYQDEVEEMSYCTHHMIARSHIINCTILASKAEKEIIDLTFFLCVP